MRTSALLREVAAAITSGTARVTQLSLAFALAIGALVALELGSVAQLVDGAEQYQRAGASVLILRALDGVDGVACERLGEVPGVQAAGAFSDSEQPLRVLTLPGSPVPASIVSAGFVALVTPDPVTMAGVLVSTDVSETLGVRTGGRLVTELGATTVAGVFEYPDDGRRGGLGYSALIVSSSRQLFDECWVRAWPASDQLPALLLTAIAPGKSDLDDPPTIAQLNTRLGATYDGAARFGDRLSRFAPVAAAIVGALIAVVAIRRRRLELAAALHVGVARRSAILMSVLEASAWATAGALLGTVPTAWFVASLDLPDRGAILMLASRIALVGWLGALAGTVVATAMVRERHLFRLFKDR